MANLLASGAAWQAGKLKASESVSVTLRRAGSSDAVISAVPVITRVGQEFGEGSSLRTETRDWLVVTADYLIDGVAARPQDGDQIIETVGYVTRTYAVRLGAGESCARAMDGARAMWRLHTKLVAKAASATAGTGPSGLLYSGASWQSGQLTANASVLVTLRRSGYSDVTDVPATVGTTAIEQEMEDGSSLRIDSHDFLIATSAYQFGGVVVEPADGDIVIETVAGIERQYQLRPFAGEACARPMDQFRLRWRCHTKLIESSEDPVADTWPTENQLRALLGLFPIVGDTWDENEIRHMAGLVSLGS